MKKYALVLLVGLFSGSLFADTVICKVKDSFDGINDSEYKIDIYPKKTAKNTVSKLDVQTNGFKIIRGSVAFDRGDKDQLIQVTHYSEVPLKFKKGQCGHMQYVTSFDLETNKYRNRVQWLQNPAIPKHKCLVPHPPKPQYYDMSCGSGN